MPDDTPRELSRGMWFAFYMMWGAALGAVFTVVTSTLIIQFIGASAILAVVIIAPLVEEAAKSSFILSGTVDTPREIFYYAMFVGLGVGAGEWVVLVFTGNPASYWNIFLHIGFMLPFVPLIHMDEGPKNRIAALLMAWGFHAAWNWAAYIPGGA